MFYFCSLEVNREIEARLDP